MQAYTMLRPKPARVTLSALFFTLELLKEFELRAASCTTLFFFFNLKFLSPHFFFFSLFMKITPDNIPL